MKVHAHGHGVLSAAKRARVTVASRDGVEGRLTRWGNGDLCRVLIGGRHYNVNKDDIDIVEHVPVPTREHGA